MCSGISVTGPVAHPGFFPQGNIGLAMQLIGGKSDDGYKIDDVRMSERNPPRTS